VPTEAPRGTAKYVEERQTKGKTKKDVNRFLKNKREREREREREKDKIDERLKN